MRRPLLKLALRKGSYDLSCLHVLGSGGAILSPPFKEAFLEPLPNLLIFDGFGSSPDHAEHVLHHESADLLRNGTGHARHRRTTHLAKISLDFSAAGVKLRAKRVNIYAKMEGFTITTL